MIDLKETLDDPHGPGRKLFPVILEANLGEIASRRKLQQAFLEAVRLYFDADAAFLHRLRFVDEEVAEPLQVGEGQAPARDVVQSFVRQEGPQLGHDLLLAPIRVCERLAGVVAATREEGFPKRSGYDLLKLAAVYAEELSRREDERAQSVLDDINREILQQLRPRDVSYHILKGLQQLVRYDHSAALLTYDRGAGALRLDAERIAWTKAKSPFIGRHRPISAPLAEELRQLGVAAAGRSGDSGAVLLEPAGELAEALAYHEEGSGPMSTSTLVAPLVAGDDLLGLLQVSAWRRPPFNAWDARVVGRFLLAASYAMNHAHLRLDQERRAVESARKSHLMNMARVVAHDINNAIGTILPLTQQAADELREGDFSAETLAEDMQLVVGKAELARSLFHRLLSQEKNLGAKHCCCDLNRVIRDRLDLMKGAIKRRGVELHLDLEPKLPAAAIFRQNLEHLVWNLVENALDALPLRGGELTLTSRTLAPDKVSFTVEDNGGGIGEEQRGRIFEPFYTTKRGGTGLGLPLCLSLLREADGSMHLESEPGKGTTVRVELPMEAPATAAIEEKTA